MTGDTTTSDRLLVLEIEHGLPLWGRDLTPEQAIIQRCLRELKELRAELDANEDQV